MAKEKKKEAEEEAPEEKKEEAKEGAEGEAEGGEGEAAAEEGGGKSKKKLIIIAAAAVVVLLIAGGAAFFLLSHKSVSGEEAKAGEGGAAKVEQPVYYDLPEILVNLNTSGKQTSFIKASVTLELSAKEDTPVVEANLPRLMDSYNTFLREMRATDLYGSAGVYRLREEMLSRANTILAPVQVKDVLFRQILVQ